MSPQLQRLRDELEARVRKAQRERTDQKKVVTCTHQWQRFRQTVPVTNDTFNGSAFFVINGCLLCKAKVYIDYVMERG